MASLESISQGIEDFVNKPSVQNVLSTGAFASDVYAITKSTSDAGLASGYGAWIESITGSKPQIKNLGNNQAQIDLSPEQIKLMQGWLDTQVSSALTPGKPKPNLQINFGPVVKPWAVRYGAPALLTVFALGWLLRWGMYK